MRIEYNGKIHETEINDKGHVVSKEGNIFFGISEDNIINGKVYEEPVEEVKLDNSWTIPQIKAWLDERMIPYTSSMLKDDLLALV